MFMVYRYDSEFEIRDLINIIEINEINFIKFKIILKYKHLNYLIHSYNKF